MALTDIVGRPGEGRCLCLLPSGSLGNPVDISEQAGAAGLRDSFKHVPGWPAAGDVKLNIPYGPTGVEYNGSYAPGGAVTSWAY